MADRPVDQVIRRIVADVLGRSIQPGEVVSRDTEPHWDSLKHMEILFAIEDELGIQFGEAELANLGTLEEIVAAAERLRAA